VDANEKKAAWLADDGSTQNVEHCEHSTFDHGTSGVDWYEYEDGDDAHTDEEEAALQADDESTQNVGD
jgi:hypothetical protein